MKAIDLIGRRFGRLVVVRRAEKSAGSGQARWECVCDCGGTTITQYGGDNPLTSITYFGERTAECPHNNVSFYARDYDRDDLPAYAAGHLADAKRIAAEWSQS